MNINIYIAFHANNAEKKISKIELDDSEWLIFLQNVPNQDIINIDSNMFLTSKDVERIDTNQCVPLCRNFSFIKRYNADTDMVSIVNGYKGNIYLRLWLAENGINTTLNSTINEVFSSASSINILNNFWNWWNKLPLEPQPVGNILISKQYKEFGIGHLFAWIKSLLNEEEPKAASDKYIYIIKPWMHAYELMNIWTKKDLIINNDGKMTPNHQK
jgi:hypothetical protein